MGAELDLSIIIVNWNSKEFLRTCIDSIKADNLRISYEIIVIDSGSFDGCDKMLQKHYPEVNFIQNDCNIGFAKANNKAFKVSQGRNLLFLNPDTLVTRSAIYKLYHNLCSLPLAGAVGARLLNKDGSLQTTCIRCFPTILNQFVESDLLRRWFPRSSLWGMAPLFAKSEEPKEVDAVSGACLMIKRSVFESVGMFSNEYFMYSEDIDICLLIKSGGWKTYYIPSAVVVHYGGESSTKSYVSDFSSVMMIESRWVFFLKTRPFWYCRFYRLSVFIASLTRIGMLIPIWVVCCLSGREFKFDGVFKKWAGRLRWSIGVEKK